MFAVLIFAENLLFDEAVYAGPYGLPLNNLRAQGGWMEKEAMLDKAKSTLAPFETENIINFLKHVTLKSAMENPLVIAIFLVFFFFAVVKRSKPVLLTLFSVIAIMFLVRFTLPADAENELTLSSTLPFAFGGLAIGAALIYFMFIKGD